MKQLKLYIIAVAISSTLIATSSNTFAAGDIAAGKKKAAICATCHGTSGISDNPMWPNLAGQKDLYIIRQLKAFKSGARKDPLMSPQSAVLSDIDMENLAAYYSTLK